MSACLRVLLELCRGLLLENIRTRRGKEEDQDGKCLLVQHRQGYVPPRPQNDANGELISHCTVEYCELLVAVDRGGFARLTRVSKLEGSLFLPRVKHSASAHLCTVKGNKLSREPQPQADLAGMSAASMAATASVASAMSCFEKQDAYSHTTACCKQSLLQIGNDHLFHCSLLQQDTTEQHTCTEPNRFERLEPTMPAAERTAFDKQKTNLLATGTRRLGGTACSVLDLLCCISPHMNSEE